MTNPFMSEPPPDIRHITQRTRNINQTAFYNKIIVGVYLYYRTNTSIQSHSYIVNTSFSQSLTISRLYSCLILTKSRRKICGYNQTSLFSTASFSEASGGFSFLMLLFLNGRRYVKSFSFSLSIASEYFSERILG